MDRIFRVDLYPHEFLTGITNLKPDERGVYLTIILLIYCARGPINNDPAWIGNASNCSSRFAVSMIRRLIEVEKIFLTPEGKLTNKRAENVLKDVRARSEKGANMRRTQDENKAQSNKNNKITPAAQPHKHQHQHQHQSSKNPLPPSGAGAPEIRMAYDLFNESAKRCGVPIAQSLSQSRSGKIAARLRDAGGLDGWKIALEKMETSDFCTGRKTDFKAGIDFILQESSFTKLMEGNYDNGHRLNGKHAAESESFSRAAYEHDKHRHGGDMPGQPARDSDLFDEGHGKVGKV